MAMSLNRVQLIGNLTREPEMRQIPGGQTVATFTVATNLSWTDQSGQRQDKPEYHNIVAWRKLAEICGQYLKKGSKVFVEGRLQTREWEAEDGSKRYKTEIVADNMIMLDRKGGELGSAPRSASEEAPQAKAKSAPPAMNKEEMIDEEEIAIEDLPF